ncbi:MAG: branched-chain amino acid ABC transporter permease [Desulfomonile tiedjei]|nr:branched-chain amino acid ABC transporter permease [Desulfomonile tiedjei]
MQDLLQPILNGILLGGLYAAVAVGLSMIFGVVKMVNLAHGDLMIVGSYLCLVCTGMAGVNPLLSIVIVGPAMFVVGFLMQRYLFNRVLHQGMEPPLIVTLGVSVILQNALLLVFSPDARSLATDLSVRTIRVSDTLRVPVPYLIGFLVGIITIAALHRFLKGTNLGRAIRAASDDEGAAQLMGVDTGITYAYAMGIAAMTAAIAGILVGMTFTFYPHTGPQYLIIAFGVVIIGGVGSMIGTLLGGMILGLAQLLGAHFLGPGFQLLSGYLVLLVVLALRPQGIFGKRAHR